MDQWAGTIEFAKAQLRSDIYIGCRLKLIGPTTTFSNVLPQRIVERPCSGATQVTFGPAPQMSPDFLLELMRGSRVRTTYRLSAGRDTGQDQGQSDVDTGSDAPTDDTAHSPGGNEFDSVSGPVDLFT